MGSNTYELDSTLRLKPEATDASGEVMPDVALDMSLALSQGRETNGFGAPRSKDEAEDGIFPAPVAAELACYGLDCNFALTSERPPYSHKGHGIGPTLAAQLLAPWIAPGSWVGYETEGYAWAIVWDGVTAHEVNMIPKAPPGVVLL